MTATSRTSASILHSRLDEAAISAQAGPRDAAKTFASVIATLDKTQRLAGHRVERDGRFFRRFAASLAGAMATAYQRSLEICGFRV